MRFGNKVMFSGHYRLLEVFWKSFGSKLNSDKCNQFSIPNNLKDIINRNKASIDKRGKKGEVEEIVNSVLTQVDGKMDASAPRGQSSCIVMKRRQANKALSEVPSGCRQKKQL